MVVLSKKAMGRQEGINAPAFPKKRKEKKKIGSLSKLNSFSFFKILFGGGEGQREKEKPKQTLR